MRDRADGGRRRGLDLGGSDLPRSGRALRGGPRSGCRRSLPLGLHRHRAYASGPGAAGILGDVTSGPAVAIRSTRSTIRRAIGPSGARRLRGWMLGARHLRPDFVIIGAARSGTTHLLGQLNAHPNVLPGPAEVHYFDTHRHTYGMGWYRTRFPTIAGSHGRGAAGPPPGPDRREQPVLPRAPERARPAGPRAPRREAARAPARPGGAGGVALGLVPAPVRRDTLVPRGGRGRDRATRRRRAASASRPTGASATRSSCGGASTSPSSSAG